MLTREDIVESASDTIFGKPLITNVYRSVIVEALVAAVLPDWQWVSADYFEHDFLHVDGTRLEVKQSAMKQTWATKGTAKPAWDIAERKQVWKDDRWVPIAGRHADIYVLALHDVLDETADHREPSQWKFLVIPTFKLPAAKKIGLGPASRLSDLVRIEHLPAAVAQASQHHSNAARMTWEAGDLQPIK